jgi:hypothetical protein
MVGVRGITRGARSCRRRLAAVVHLDARPPDARGTAPPDARGTAPRGERALPAIVVGALSL